MKNINLQNKEPPNKCQAIKYKETGERGLREM